MASHVGIVYATRSKILRRVIGFDSPEQAYTHPLHPGESLIVVDHDYIDLVPGAHVSDFARAQVERATGHAPPSGRCAVVDSAGRVVDVVQADPDIDSIPGMRLISNDVASPGWWWDDQHWRFIAPPSAPGPQSRLR